MGKLTIEMTDEEIKAQRERAKRNYHKMGKILKKCITCGKPATGWKYCDRCKAYLKPKKQKTKPKIGRCNIIQAIMDGK